MSSMYGSGEGGPFDEFFARFFGAPGQRRPAYRVDMMRLLTEQARALVTTAAQRAVEGGRADVDAVHLLWATTRDDATRRLLSGAGADPDALARELEQHLGPGPAGEQAPALTPAAKRTLLDAHQISRALGSSYIGPEHILFALAVNPDSSAGRFLRGTSVTPESLQQAAQQAASGAGAGGGGGQAERRTQSNTPTLDEYGVDITALAGEGRIDPVVGRDDEVEQTVEVLSRRTKNNPVLIGEAGVGKTAIVEGIAQRISDGEVPDTLRGRRLVQIDMTSLVAGTRYRGDFEDRLKNVMDEIRGNSDDLIAFIDELHTVVGAGAAEGSMGAGNILKPALARGELHVIGATTLEEYRKNVETDAALERRFQPILVAEPTVEDATSILRGLQDRYEAHHQVRYTDEALVAAVELSDRYITDRFLPDKAIDLIDQAGARVRLRTGTPTTDVRELEQQVDALQREKDEAVTSENYERATAVRDQIAELQKRMTDSTDDGGVLEVTVDDIAEVVARSTGIPVSQLTEAERDRLLQLEQRLHERVVGQDEAVGVVAEAVRRSRAGLGDPNQPIGSFCFLGPTGVGKTELARALAASLFGEEERMIRLDMSEFQERHNVSRLVGAPPGYVGYEEAGQLTEAVRRRPYSVVLLDEIEKAHTDVFNLLLQVLDDGRLTDGKGRTVDFRNTVVIMTSNLGSELIVGGRGHVGFDGTGSSTGSQNDAIRDQIMRRLRDTFRPEFLNRIDEVVIFQRLENEQLRQITELLIGETRRRLHAQNITVDFTDQAVDRLAEMGHEAEYGARPLRRTIQREIDNRLSRLLLNGEIEPGHTVQVGAEDGEFTFRQAESAA